jgi:ABC-type branched-subunit amino acid transport system ATPase component
VPAAARHTAARLRLQEMHCLASLLRKLGAEGKGVLIIEHNMDFVMQLADPVMETDFGATIGEGPAAPVDADPAVQEAYLGGVA